MGLRLAYPCSPCSAPVTLNLAPSGSARVCLQEIACLCSCRNKKRFWKAGLAFSFFVVAFNGGICLEKKLLCKSRYPISVRIADVLKDVGVVSKAPLCARVPSVRLAMFQDRIDLTGRKNRKGSMSRSKQISFSLLAGAVSVFLPPRAGQHIYLSILYNFFNLFMPIHTPNFFSYLLLNYNAK